MVMSLDVDQPIRPYLGPDINRGWYALLACITAKKDLSINDALYYLGIYPGPRHQFSQRKKEPPMLMHRRP